MSKSFNSVSLPNEPINSKLKSILASTLLPTTLANACSKTAQELVDACAATGRVDYDEVERLMKVWDVIDAEQARARRDYIISSFRRAVANSRAASSPPMTHEKSPFNHEYIPLLDKYFEYNAYPSAADRLILARKSMMTPRQIEVWFQNHRNRAKKEGKILRRLKDVPLPSEFFLASLKQTMPFFVVPEHERKSVLKSKPIDDPLDEEESPVTSYVNQVKFDVLDPPRPSYAFPTPFSAPVWYRTPALAPCQHIAEIDMESFASVFFQKLHLRVPTPKKMRPSNALPWHTNRSTVPSPAPLPALVQRPLCHNIAFSTYPSKSPSEHLTLLSPSTTFHSAIPPNPPTVDLTSSRRHVARLPKRIPPQISIARPQSPSSSQSPSNPSFQTMLLNRRRSPSGSSSSSSVSVPATPTSSHAISSPEIYPLSFLETQLASDETSDKKSHDVFTKERRNWSRIVSTQELCSHSHFHQSDRFLEFQNPFERPLQLSVA